MDANTLENQGGAIFKYVDKEYGISLNFVFNLRYYLSKPRVEDQRVFEVEGEQKSIPYGEINLRKIQMRQNKNSSEFVLLWDHKIKNESIRASSRIAINNVDPFVRFDVETNEVPVADDQLGKNVVADWYLLDGFDTGNKFFVDANGLQMVERRLDGNKPQSMVVDGFLGENRSVSANYHPVTSAISVVDTNKTQGNFTEKQITILNDRPQGGSAGLRRGKNIELMQQRRQYHYGDYGTHEYLNDLDGLDGKGLQIAASYYMLVEDSKSPSLQRQVQKRLEQPLPKYYSHNFNLNGAGPEYQAERTGPLYELDE
jgi:hypothetical protein